MSLRNISTVPEIRKNLDEKVFLQQPPNANSNIDNLNCSLGALNINQPPPLNPAHQPSRAEQQQQQQPPPPQMMQQNNAAGSSQQQQQGSTGTTGAATGFSPFQPRPHHPPQPQMYTAGTFAQVSFTRRTA